MAKSRAKKPAEPPPSPVPSVEVHIPAATEYVRVARLAVTGVASRMNYSYEDIEDIKLAVSEACNNAILHARPAAEATPDRVARIQITITPHADRLEISITDEGNATSGDMHQAAQRAVSRRAQAAADLPESGFGLLLIQSLMDAIAHEGDGVSINTIRMTKYLPGQGISPRHP